ncbi:FAD-binding oxidoreductase [Amycolatopsis acidicola]|uniref:FAD-binding oxidoreductase n=1 Tax=Amycolatopsis acidicola TaxID=2596893 RepID=A0A5N0VIV4_9PSEU|nr:FAD-binding oxidoreductase [Amycolatopsis acidicola]KAA9166125.1 FAD-binding oxidoreductase [Amycolatopsis acidicola]
MPEALAADLRRVLEDSADVSADEAARKASTKDFSWVSPIIHRTIPRTLPDAVVTVRSAEAVRTLARYAHEHRIPLTARGKGTSNYGQIIPLAGGIMVDFHDLTGETELHEDGTVTTLAGTTWHELSAFLDGTGREPAMFPTTLNSTVAGYVGGGAGGPGSIEHGFNHEGFVQRLTLVPVTADAEPVELRFPATTPHVHAFGTTGLITRVGLRTVPAVARTAVFASVPGLDAGAAMALEILRLSPAPQILAVTEPELAALFPEDPGFEPGRTNLRTVVAVEQAGAVREIVARAGGSVSGVRADAVRFLATFINNHTTVRAKARRPELFHVLVRGNGILGKRALIAEAFPGATVQLEGIRGPEGPCLMARILAPHRDDAAVHAGMDLLRAEELFVDSPHSWVVHENLPPRWAEADRFDPAGLLNPGKLPRTH